MTIQPSLEATPHTNNAGGPLVMLEYRDGLAIVTLNRPEKYNALNFAMFKQIVAIQRQIRANRGIRAVLLCGAGGNFSAGLDIASVTAKPRQVFGLLAKWLPGNANLAQQVSIGWTRLPLPVIAVLEGYCYGGGMQIALGADIRIASAETKLSVMEAKWGLVPDMAGLASLRAILPKDKVLELTWTARVLDGSEAKAFGLVSRLAAEPMAEALAFAKELTQRSPDALAAIKQSTHKNWAASIRALLWRESWYQIRLLLGRNFRIAVSRERGKTDQTYRPRQGFW